MDIATGGVGVGVEMGRNQEAGEVVQVMLAELLRLLPVCRTLLEGLMSGFHGSQGFEIVEAGGLCWGHVTDWVKFTEENEKVSKTVPVQLVSFHGLWESKAGEVKSGWGVLKSFRCLLRQPGLKASNCSVFAPIQLRWHLSSFLGASEAEADFLGAVKTFAGNSFPGQVTWCEQSLGEGTPRLPALPVLSSRCPNAWFCHCVISEMDDMA